MTTPKQLAANRLNARFSSGPKTPQGRARSAQNSLRHGLTADCVLLPGEDPEVWAAFRIGYYEALDPIGAAECSLVDDIIADSWRLGRVAWIEAGALRQLMTQLQDPIGAVMEPRLRRSCAELEARGVHPDDVSAAFMAVDSEGFLTERLPRYQSKSARRRERNMALLFALQARRRRRAAEDDVEDSPNHAEPPATAAGDPGSHVNGKMPNEPNGETLSESLDRPELSEPMADPQGESVNATAASAADATSDRDALTGPGPV